MKKILLLALLCLPGVATLAQKIRFTDPTNVWTLTTTERGPGQTGIPSSSTCSYLKDTLLGAVLYHELSWAYFVREDTISNKVFLRYMYGGDTSEHLLYDYDWAIGDTMTTANHNSAKYWVYKIDSTRINGNWYKVWQFEGYPPAAPSPLYHYNIIEGIGCTNGLLYPLDPTQEGGICVQLTCFSNAGKSYPLSNPVTAWWFSEYSSMQFDNSASCTLGTIDISKPSDDRCTLFPNPGDPTTKIILPYSIPSGQLTITNYLGQIIHNTLFQNKDELLIGDKISSPGVYIYHIADLQTGQMFSGKFIYR